MNLNEFAEKYSLLKDEKGWYKLKNGERVEPHATLAALAKILGITSPTIVKNIKGKHLLPKAIKSSNNIPQKGYNLNEVISACSYLLGDIPIANKSGIAVIDGQRFAALRTLKRIFGLSVDAIYGRIKNFEIKKFKLQSGQLLEGYNINAAKKACADLLQEFPAANKKGIAVINGQKFTTPYTLTKLLQLSHNAINPRIRKAGLKSQEIKVRDGNIRLAYNIAEVKKSCSDLLNQKHIANNSNIVVIDGHKYTTLENLIRLFKISNEPIKRRIRDNKIPIQKIKINGRVLNGYEIIKVRKACADFLKKIPTPDSDGIARVNGQEYTTIENLARILKISTPTITHRINKNSLKAIEIKHLSNGILKAYNISEVTKHCNELIQNDFVADESGFVEIDGQKFASITALAKAMEVNPNIVSQRIGGLSSISIRTRNGLREAYNFEDVKMACSDQLQDYPQADRNDMTVINGQKFASIHRIYDIYKLSQSINYRRVKEKLIPVNIRSKNGHVIEGFNVMEVITVHKELLDQKRNIKSNPASH